MSGLLRRHGLLVANDGDAPAGVVWDPAFSSGRAELSAGNLRLGCTPTGDSMVSANTRTTRAIQGKFYISCTLGSDASGAVTLFGIADETRDLTDGSGYAGQGNSVSLFSPNGTVYGGGSSVGSAGDGGSLNDAQLAVDEATREVWFRWHLGAWVGGGDPALGTAPTFILPGSGLIYVCASVLVYLAGSGRFAELPSDVSEVTGTPPAGFTALNWEA